jgi:hypothetical protein
VEERYFIRVFEIFRQAGIALGSKIEVVSKESFDLSKNKSG